MDGKDDDSFQLSCNKKFCLSTKKNDVVICNEFFDYFARKKLNLWKKGQIHQFSNSFKIYVLKNKEIFQLELNLNLINNCHENIILISLFIDFQFVFFFLYIKFVHISIKNRLFFKFFIISTIICSRIFMQLSLYRRKRSICVKKKKRKFSFNFTKIKNISHVASLK